MFNGHFFEDQAVGQSATLAKIITEADIRLYPVVSMGTNPMYLDAEMAKHGIFGERIAHGRLAVCLSSGVLGTKLPGPGAVYMRQRSRFAAPEKIGQTVKATVEVVTLNPAKKHATSRTIRTIGDDIVIEGEGYVRVRSRG